MLNLIFSLEEMSVVRVLELKSILEDGSGVIDWGTGGERERERKWFNWQSVDEETLGSEMRPMQLLVVSCDSAMMVNSSAVRLPTRVNDWPDNCVISCTVDVNSLNVLRQC